MSILSALKDWLESLAVYGVTFIKNNPSDKNVARKLIDRIGFIRQTTYGEEYVVKARPDATNQAYLSNKLQMHSDLPYYEYTPGVNLLHYLVQTKTNGGSNLLVDGFYIADIMKKEHPEYYKLLTETVVDWNDIASENGVPFHNIYRAPVIWYVNTFFYTLLEFYCIIS